MVTKHKPGKILCAVMKRLLKEAEEREGEAITHVCTNNLRIDLRIMAGIAVLLLSRSTVYPSESEWRTVLRHMPFEINIPHTQLVRSGRMWLRGQWLLQKKLDLAEKHETGLHPDRSNSQPAHAN